MDGQTDFKEDKKLISEFNEAKFQVLRLHNSWVLCNSYRRGGKLTSWKWELDTIWDELSSKAKKRGEDFSDKVKKIDGAIEKDEKSKKQSSIYNGLREKHRFLKEVQDNVGMGGKMKEEGEDDIDD